jgi:hypothetical protein
MIMLSHTADEAYLAQAWQDLIHEAFDLSRDQIWFSSDPDAMDAKGPYALQIEQKIQLAESFISIQSPVSRYRPWLLWESGIARGLNKPIYVVVYEKSDSPRKDRILDKLNTPLDAMHHYHGTDASKIRGVVDQLAKDIGQSPVATRLDSALNQYLKSVTSYEHCWVWKETPFDRQIQLVFNEEQTTTLGRTGIIAEAVEVRDVQGSMVLFGLAVDSRKWETFLGHLDTLNAPWKGSAARWARGLGHALQRALSGLLLENAEGLPLYFDARAGRRYRPSVSLQEDHGCETIFTVSFTLVPSEISAVPKTDAGTLLHYLDFARMMRWGVLEDFEVQAFFRRPYDYTVEERAGRIADFLEKIYSVRTEFWNRGLAMGAIDHAIDKDDLPMLGKLRDNYYTIIHEIDPKDTGKLPEPLPDIKIIQRIYADLLINNKGWYQLMHRNFGREIEKLAEADEAKAG